MEVLPVGMGEQWAEWPSRKKFAGVRVLLKPLLPRETTDLALLHLHDDEDDDGKPVLDDNGRTKRVVNQGDMMVDTVRRVVRGAEGLTCSGKPFEFVFETVRGVEMLTMECFDRIPPVLYEAIVSAINDVSEGLTQDQHENIVFTAVSPDTDSSAGGTKKTVNTIAKTD